MVSNIPKIFQVILPGLTWITLVVISDASITIPDSNLEQSIRAHLELSGEDEITPSKMAKLTRFQARNQGIQDLSGLEHATQLEQVNLDSNQISDLAPLSGLSNLTTLILSDNHIQDITALQGLSLLQTLDLKANHIRDISELGSLTNLKQLYLDRNPLNNADGLSTLTNLEELHLAYTGLMEVPDIKNLANLQELVIAYNGIRNLEPLTFIPGLEELYIQGNTLIDISSLKNLPNLKTVFLEENFLNLQNNATRQVIDALRQNGTVNESPQRERVYIEDSGKPFLDMLRHKLGIEDNEPITTEILLDIRNLDLSGSNFLNLREFHILPRLESLNLSNNNITDIQSIGNLRLLKSINLENNYIVDITRLRDLRHLQSVSLKQNFILSDLNRERNLDAVERLSKYVDVDITNQREIVEISVENEPLKQGINRFWEQEDTAPMTNAKLLGLGSLFIDVNQLNSLEGIQKASNINSLYLSGIQPTTDLSPLLDLPNLRVFILLETPMENFSVLSSLNKLTSLGVGVANIRDLSFLANLENLEELRLINNEIRDLSPLANLRNLRILSLKENYIRDLSVLANLEKLEELTLDGNEIRDLSPLASLENLTRLFLNNNFVSDISPLEPLMISGSLEWLKLGVNFLDTPGNAKSWDLIEQFEEASNDVFYSHQSTDPLWYFHNAYQAEDNWIHSDSLGWIKFKRRNWAHSPLHGWIKLSRKHGNGLFYYDLALKNYIFTSHLFKPWRWIPVDGLATGLWVYHYGESKTPHRWFFFKNPNTGQRDFYHETELNQLLNN